MAVLSNTGIRGGASGVVAEPEAYRVKRSARFNDDNSAYLIRTTSTAGNRKTWTISLWFKRSSFGVEQGVFNSGVSGHPSTFLKIDTSNRLEYGDYQSGYICQIVTNRVFRDPSAWYHLTIAVDTTQATEANRFKLYINGVQETSFSSANYYSQNDDTDWNNAEAHTLATKSTDEFDGYLADIYFIDGSAKAATDFAETNADTGQWVPKEYDGTYGTNGFHLAMDPANGGTNYSSAALGTFGDASIPGSVAYNGDVTYNGSPTIIPANNDVTIFKGSLVTSTNISVKTWFSGNGDANITINGSAGQTVTNYNGLSEGSASFHDISYAGTITSITMKIATNSTRFVALKADGKLLVDHTAIGYDSSGNKNHWHEKNLFGREHTTANDTFKAVAYTGTGSAQTITCGFQPDFVWVKASDSGSYGHRLVDSVRGISKYLMSHSTAAEGTEAQGITAITSTGFTVGTNGDFNNSGTKFIAWCWKAGGASSSNSDGSGTSSVSANTTAGFSVVKYTGTGASATWGHGLGKEPKLIITKDLDGTNYWNVYHEEVGYSKFLKLNDTDAEATPGATRIGATSSTTFTTGSAAGETNASGTDYIAYCFAEVEGYSKFGKYIGNDNATGPIIDCGFAPAFVFFKRSDVANNWQVFDNARSLDKDLKPNTAEAEGSAPIEFQPNGFQIKNTYNSTNADGGEYIYMAIAGPPEGDLDLLADAPGAPYDNELNGGGNYCTLNPINNAGTLSNGNLVASFAAGGEKLTTGTIGVQSGKWYWEVEKTGGSYGTVGIANSQTSTASYVGQTANSWGMAGSDGKKYTNGSSSAYGNTWGSGDIVGIAFDADAGNLYFYKNGTVQNSGTAAFTGLTSDVYFPAVGNQNFDCVCNFGQRAFAYTPPAGYKALNTYNLSDPTTVKGNTGFDIKLYDGNNGTQTISGLEFSPDLVWIKERGNTASHYLYDTVRGTQKLISSNYDGQENWAGGGSAAGEISAFTSDGFTIVNSGSYTGNANGSSYAVWNWDAGTANVSKSAGDLTSTVYDQSETWSTHLTFSNDGGGFLTNRSPADVCFDSTRTENAATGSTGTSAYIEVSGLSLTTSDTLEITLLTSDPGSLSWNVTGTNLTTTAISTRAQEFVNIPITGNANTFRVTSADTGRAHLTAIRINGKELVDSGVTVNVPSIASTYRANPNTGFSIVKWEGQGANANIAHGLNAAPGLIISKCLESSQGWNVWHKNLGANYRMFLDTNDDKETGGYPTVPTSNVFYVDNTGNFPDDQDVISYCWSEVAGYSKFGEYDGNGSGNSAVDGPFQWCGFKPKFIIIKQSDGTNNWLMLDTTRNTYNGGTTEQFLYPNLSNAENTYAGDVIDVLSNGWRPIHGEGGVNNTGDTYVWAAFAESPFKYANAH